MACPVRRWAEESDWADLWADFGMQRPSPGKNVLSALSLFTRIRLREPGLRRASYDSLRVLDCFRERRQPSEGADGSLLIRCRVRMELMVRQHLNKWLTEQNQLLVVFIFDFFLFKNPRGQKSEQKEKWRGVEALSAFRSFLRSGAFWSTHTQTIC